MNGQSARSPFYRELDLAEQPQSQTTMTAAISRRFVALANLDALQVRLRTFTARRLSQLRCNRGLERDSVRWASRIRYWTEGISSRTRRRRWNRRFVRPLRSRSTLSGWPAMLLNNLPKSRTNSVHAVGSNLFPTELRS
jgi:hypothetical protein